MFSRVYVISKWHKINKMSKSDYSCHWFYIFVCLHNLTFIMSMSTDYTINSYNIDQSSFQKTNGLDRSGFESWTIGSSNTWFWGEV